MTEPRHSIRNVGACLSLINSNLLHRILFPLRLRECRNRGFDKCCQVIPIINITDIEVVFRTVVRRSQDNILQDRPTGLSNFNIEVVVADETEENTVAISTIISHHFLDRYLPST